MENNESIPIKEISMCPEKHTSSHRTNVHNSQLYQPAQLHALCIFSDYNTEL